MEGIESQSGPTVPIPHVPHVYTTRTPPKVLIELAWKFGGL